MRLGATTPSFDCEHTVDRTFPTDHITRPEVERALASLVGERLQTPPLYSAKKIEGTRAYEFARAGEQVEMRQSLVTIYDIELLECRLPELTIRVRCSKGTYIRTLCHDIGEKLGCGGCMEELLRSRVGRYSLSESHTLAQVEAAVADGTVQDMIDPVEAVLAEYPALYADSYGDRLLANGNPLSDNLVSPQHKEGWVRMYASDGTFTGIFQWDAGEKKYYPVKMF